MNVSLYIHGMISFGALVGGMIATSGDEAFVMLTQFPTVALMLFGMLFAGGIVFAWVSDKVIQVLGIVPCESCHEDQCLHCRSRNENAEGFAAIFGSAGAVENFHSLSFTRPLPAAGADHLFYVSRLAWCRRTFRLGLETDHFPGPFHLFPLHCRCRLRALSPLPYLGPHY